MATYIRLTEYRDSQSKEQGFKRSENRYKLKKICNSSSKTSPIWELCND